MSFSRFIPFVFDGGSGEGKRDGEKKSWGTSEGDGIDSIGCVDWKESNVRYDFAGIGSCWRRVLLELGADGMSNFAVTVSIKSRIITVTGPRGKLVKDLKHLAVSFVPKGTNTISIELHHGVRKNVAALRTVKSLINNLITGVTKGYKYKMRYVYAHFPINVNIEENPATGTPQVEIR